MIELREHQERVPTGLLFILFGVDAVSMTKGFIDKEDGFRYGVTIIISIEKSFETGDANVPARSQQRRCRSSASPPLGPQGALSR